MFPDNIDAETIFILLGLLRQIFFGSSGLSVLDEDLK
jgi:hypothetical protein